MDSNILRKEILSARNKLSPEAVSSLSQKISKHFLSLPEVCPGKTLMLFASFRSEVRTDMIIDHCLGSGIRIALPVTLTAERKLLPYLVEDRKELKRGYCNIPEPDPFRAEKMTPGDIDLVVVPGSVFDMTGGRLGYGGGFYDRFLAEDAPQALRVGLAFTAQVVKKNLPLAEHDQKIDLLVTEEGTLRFKG